MKETIDISFVEFKNVKQLAEELDTSRQTVYKKIKLLGFENDLKRENGEILLSSLQCDLIRDSIKRKGKFNENKKSEDLSEHLTIVQDDIKVKDSLILALQNQVESLQSERDRLLALIESQQQTIVALTSALPLPEEEQSETKEEKAEEPKEEVIIIQEQKEEEPAGGFLKKLLKRILR